MEDPERRVYGVAEIAQAVGISRDLAAQWHRRGKLPPPTDRLATGPVWTRDAIVGNRRGPRPSVRQAVRDLSPPDVGVEFPRGGAVPSLRRPSGGPGPFSPSGLRDPRDAPGGRDVRGRHDRTGRGPDLHGPE